MALGTQTVITMSGKKQPHESTILTERGASMKDKPRKNKVLGVPLSPELRGRLEERAALEGRSLASLARFAIVQYLTAQQRLAWEGDAPVLEGA